MQVIERKILYIIFAKLTIKKYRLQSLGAIFLNSLFLRIKISLRFVHVVLLLLVKLCMCVNKPTTQFQKNYVYIFVSSCHLYVSCYLASKGIRNLIYILCYDTSVYSNHTCPWQERSVSFI